MPCSIRIRILMTCDDDFIRTTLWKSWCPFTINSNAPKRGGIGPRCTRKRVPMVSRYYHFYLVLSCLVLSFLFFSFLVLSCLLYCLVLFLILTVHWTVLPSVSVRKWCFLEKIYVEAVFLNINIPGCFRFYIYLDDDCEMDFHDDVCRVCGKEGELLCCDTCEAAYHVTCLTPEQAPASEEETWCCPLCQQRLKTDADKELAFREVRVRVYWLLC